MRSRAAEAGGGCEDERASLRFAAGLEIGNGGDRGLVHVAAEHEVHAGVDECAQDLAAPVEGSLVRGAPRRRCKVMVESHDAEHSAGRRAHAFRGRS